MLLTVFISTLLIFTPLSALAGGGPEPGAGCPGGGILGYVPPPFIGDVTLTFAGNAIHANGFISQAGNPACVLTITANNYIAPVLLDEWNNLTPPNLRQRCLEEGQFDVGEFCEAEYSGLVLYESVGAGDIRDDNPDTKIVRFVVMGLE